MFDASRQQAAPTKCPDSRDVLEALRGEVSDELFMALEERAVMGEKKYGTRLMSFNGRDCLLDAKQEAYDLIMYGKQAEMEGLSKGYVWKRAVAVIALIETLERT